MGQSLMLLGMDFTLLSELPQYVSLTVKRAYWEVGGFKLTLKRGMPGWDKLARERLLFSPDRPEMMLLIEKVTFSEDKAVADGVPLKGLAKRRVCVPPREAPEGDPYRAFGWDRFTGDAESAYLHYAANNLTAPEDEKRAMPRMSLAENLHRGAELPWQARFDRLHELFEDIGAATGVGWDIRPDFAHRRFAFTAWVGNDLTVGGRRAALSRRLGNLEGSTLTDDGSTEVSTVYAGGSGEDENRLIVSVGNERAGFDRREGWTDVSGVEDIDMLRLGAERKLSPVKRTITATVRDSGLCRYGRDYDVGDVVTVLTDEARMDARLVAMEETSEGGTRRLKATFGDAPVTLTSLLRGQAKGTVR